MEDEWKKLYRDIYGGAEPPGEWGAAEWGEWASHPAVQSRQAQSRQGVQPRQAQSRQGVPDLVDVPSMPGVKMDPYTRDLYQQTQKNVLDTETNEYKIVTSWAKFGSAGPASRDATTLQVPGATVVIGPDGKPISIPSPDPQEWLKTKEGAQWAAANAMDQARLQASLRAPAAAGAQFDWGKTQAGYEGDWASQLAKQQEASRGTQVATQIKADADQQIAAINADAALSAAEKQVEIARINAQSAKDAAEAKAATDRYIAELQDAASQRQTAAQAAIAEGNWALARDQLGSAEKIAAVQAQVQREASALSAYSQLLQVESQERASRAQSAASIFGTLAQLAPQDQLRAAFYTLRGQAPPPSTMTQLPPGLLSALGANPDTVSAAAQQLRGAVSAPPWLQQLMGGKGA